MFEPPRCPHAECPMHSNPTPDFFIRRGYYRSTVKPYPIPRFQCRGCLRRFSRQTFQDDYRDKKPHLNVLVFQWLWSGFGYRHSARKLEITRRNLVNKARKIRRNMGKLDRSLLERAGAVDGEDPRRMPLPGPFDKFKAF